VVVAAFLVDDAAAAAGLFVVLAGEAFFRLWARVELFFVVVVDVVIGTGLGRVCAAWAAAAFFFGVGVDDDLEAVFRELREEEAVLWPFVLVLFRGEVVVTVSSIVCVIVMISAPRSMIMLSLPWSSAKHAWT
jgi:hypothetical protein